MSNEEVNLISLSPSDGWAIPIEKYSSVLLEGLWGLLQWYDSHLNTILKPSASFPAVVALQKNGLHTTLLLSFAQKQNKET